MRNWERKKLSVLCDLITKGTTPTSIGFKFTDEGINFIKVESLTESGEIIPNKVAYIDEECHNALKRSQLKVNDILFSIAGALGRIGIVRDEIVPANTNQALAIIRLKNDSGVLVNYLAKYFNSNLITNEIEKLRGGAAQQNLSLTQLNELEIPLPPLPEQQRIVSILDEAFAAIAKAKANAEQNLKNAKELFESYLQGVFEKKGDGWEEKKLIEITSKIGSGATPRGGNESYKSEGISLVRSMNVHDFEFREKNLAFIDDQQAKELNNVTLQENDVLLNITGASVARCCVIPKEYLPARVNQHVSIIRAKKEIIDPIFLNLLLTSKFYKDQLLFTGEQGATRQAITKAQLEVFKIAFPKSINEQKSLMIRLGNLSRETKKLETIYQQKINDLEELKKSVLQKAFSGSLNYDL
jgi:type I restriction enzyme S subunit